MLKQLLLLILPHLLTLLHLLTCSRTYTYTRSSPPSLNQTKIFEVLELKENSGEKLWVSDECMVLDAVKKVSV